jgi:hypothetical protein
VPLQQEKELLHAYCTVCYCKASLHHVFKIIILSYDHTPCVLLAC